MVKTPFLERQSRISCERWRGFVVDLNGCEQQRRASSRPRPPRWWISRIGSSAVTGVPGGAKTIDADARIDRRVEPSRPAPSITAARPTSSACSVRHEPAARRQDVIAIGRRGHPRGSRRSTRGSPPWFATMAADFSRPAPDRRARREPGPRPSRRSVRRPATISIRAASIDRQRLDVRRTVALQRLEAFDDLERVADRAAQGASMRVMQRLGAYAGRLADGDERFRERRESVAASS